MHAHYDKQSDDGESIIYFEFFQSFKKMFKTYNFAIEHTGPDLRQRLSNSLSPGSGNCHERVRNVHAVNKFQEKKKKKNTDCLIAHTAAFKLGALFDILALFSMSRVNL